MLSALLRAGRYLTAGLSCLSTADSILMSYVNLAILDFAGLPLLASAGESLHAVGVSTDAGVSSVCPVLCPYHHGRRGSRRSSRWRASLTLKARPPSVVPLSPSIAVCAEEVPLRA